MAGSGVPSSSSAEADVLANVAAYLDAHGFDPSVPIKRDTDARPALLALANAGLVKLSSSPIPGQGLTLFRALAAAEAAPVRAAHRLATALATSSSTYATVSSFSSSSASSSSSPIVSVSLPAHAPRPNTVGKLAADLVLQVQAGSHENFHAASWTETLGVALALARTSRGLVVRTVIRQGAEVDDVEVTEAGAPRYAGGGGQGPPSGADTVVVSAAQSPLIAETATSAAAVQYARSGREHLMVARFSREVLPVRVSVVHDYYGGDDADGGKESSSASEEDDGDKPRTRSVGAGAGGAAAVEPHPPPSSSPSGVVDFHSLVPSPALHGLVVGRTGQLPGTDRGMFDAWLRRAGAEVLQHGVSGRCGLLVVLPLGPGTVVRSSARRLGLREVDWDEFVESFTGAGTGLDAEGEATP
jgi:hypothetical protein